MRPPAGAEVQVEGAAKSFGGVSALRDVSLRVGPGEAIAITGRSGSGKSTLLALIGGLEQPDRGRVLIGGRAIWKQTDVARARRELVGFVFQRHLLLEALSARANVEVPLIVVSYDAAVGARADRTVTLLDGALAGDDECAVAGAPSAALPAEAGTGEDAPSAASSAGAGASDVSPADASSTVGG